MTGVSDTSQGRPYAYLPIAAGGTSFPYQIRFDGKQVRDLRLSGETIAKIFTNQITNWDNPEITRDNNGHALPSLPIIPVVQGEGSGATAQLTRYFATEYPSIWQPYSGLKGMTEYFPRQGDQIAQNGSNAAMNYVTSSVANGAIGYVEYSYALSVNYPVVKLLNKAGYFTLPTQYNVAVALEKAIINMDKSSPDYLLQNLNNVYTDPDPRTYPLSSYVYMIEPTGKYPSPETKITTAKRQSIADFLYYSICQGQKEIGPIGYSPLPVNLVEAGFGQIEKLKQADGSIDLSERNIQTCDNPTFVEGHPNTNYLAKIAPLPAACDRSGAGPCGAGVTPNGTGPTPTTTPDTTTTTLATRTTTTTLGGGTRTGTTVAGGKKTTTHKGAGPTSTTSPGSSGTRTGSDKGSGGSSTGSGGSSTGSAGSSKGSGGSSKGSGGSSTGTTVVTTSGSTAPVAHVDPSTGQVVAGSSDSSGGSDPPQIIGTTLAGYGDSSVLAPLAAVLLLLALVLPASIAYRLRRRRER